MHSKPIGSFGTNSHVRIQKSSCHGTLMHVENFERYNSTQSTTLLTAAGRAKMPCPGLLSKYLLQLTGTWPSCKQATCEPTGLSPWIVPSFLPSGVSCSKSLSATEAWKWQFDELLLGYQSSSTPIQGPAANCVVLNHQRASRYSQYCESCTVCFLRKFCQRTVPGKSIAAQAPNELHRAHELSEGLQCTLWHAVCQAK